MFKFLVPALLLAAPQVFADDLISCKLKRGTRPTVLEYIMKSTQTNRLNSPIFYTNSAGAAGIFQQSEVAQYGATSQALMVLVDNAEEKPVMRFVGSKVTGGFSGTISEFNPDGTIKMNIGVNCTKTAL